MELDDNFRSHRGETPRRLQNPVLHNFLFKVEDQNEVKQKR